jgi:hypothetical protein
VDAPSTRCQTAAHLFWRARKPQIKHTLIAYVFRGINYTFYDVGRGSISSVNMTAARHLQGRRRGMALHAPYVAGLLLQSRYMCSRYIWVPAWVYEIRTCLSSREKVDLWIFGNLYSHDARTPAPTSHESILLGNPPQINRPNHDSNCHSAGKLLCPPAHCSGH